MGLPSRPLESFPSFSALTIYALRPGGAKCLAEAMMATRDRPFADGRPNAPCDGLQTKSVFVAGEDFDRTLGMFRGFLGDGVFEVFLNAAASSGVADFGFLGRGRWIDQPGAFSASQPR